MPRLQRELTIPLADQTQLELTEPLVENEEEEFGVPCLHMFPQDTENTAYVSISIMIF